MLERILGATKAWKAGASFVGTFLVVLTTQFWTDTDPLEVRDFVITTGLSLAAGGLTFLVPNPQRRR